MSTTTPPQPRRSRRRLPPLRVVTNADEKSYCNHQQNDKEHDAEEEEEDQKPCLSLRQRSLILLGLVLVAFLIVWQSKPFERVIAAILPQLNETNATRSSTTTETPNVTIREPFAFQQCHDNATECCNGLDNICDLRVNDVLFATLHNGMATKQDGSFLHPNHLLSLESALEAGYRGLHLQICNCNGVYQFCRDYCHLGARNPARVFLNMDRFLRDNPNDVLLLTLQLNSNVDQTVQLEDVYQLMKNTSNLVRKLYVHQDDEKEEQWPTLRTMIRSDKRILLFHYDGPTCNRNSDCPAGMHYWHKYALETKSDMASLTDLAQAKKSCFVNRKKHQDNNNTNTVSETQKFFAVHNHLQVPDRKTSQVANAYDFVSNRVETCSEKNGDLPVNLLSVDFWQEGNVVEYVQRHNRKRGAMQGYIAV